MSFFQRAYKMPHRIVRKIEKIFGKKNITILGQHTIAKPAYMGVTVYASVGGAPEAMFSVTKYWREEGKPVYAAAARNTPTGKMILSRITTEQHRGFDPDVVHTSSDNSKIAYMWGRKDPDLLEGMYGSLSRFNLPVLSRRLKKKVKKPLSSSSEGPSPSPPR